VVVMRPSYHPH